MCKEILGNFHNCRKTKESLGANKNRNRQTSQHNILKYPIKKNKILLVKFLRENNFGCRTLYCLLTVKIKRHCKHSMSQKFPTYTDYERINKGYTPAGRKLYTNELIMNKELPNS